MGEYFKDESQKEKLVQEVTLITDFNVLCSTFTILVNKIEETTSQGYEAILPIRHELSGGGRGPDDTGQIGDLRRQIQNSRLWRMPMGNIMWNALKNIEDLDRWSERYVQYIETHMDSLQLIVKSAFSIINGQNKKINEMGLEIRRLNDRIVAQVDAMPMPLNSDALEIESKRFRNLLNDALEKYEEAKKRGDAKLIKLATAKVFEVCENDYVKWEIAQKEMGRIEKKMQKLSQQTETKS